MAESAAISQHSIGHDLQPTEVETFRRLVFGSEGVDPSPIVLFGEGNFTFSIALSSLRSNGSNGIKATTLDQPLPQFGEVKEINIDYCHHNGEIQKLSVQEIEQNIASVSRVTGDFSKNWQIGVDATNIPEELQVAGKVVWFQCPWSKNTAKLLQGFIQEMKRKQDVNDTLVLGISTHKAYIGRYSLINVLGERPGENVIDGYRYIGHNESITKEILGRGYKHEGYYEIHDYISCNHSILVLKREDDDDDDVSGLTENMAGMALNSSLNA